MPELLDIRIAVTVQTLNIQIRYIIYILMISSKISAIGNFQGRLKSCLSTPLHGYQNIPMCHMHLNVNA